MNLHLQVQRSRFQFPPGWAVIWLLMIWMVAAPWAVAAEQPELELGRPYFQDNKVVLDVQLRGFFQEKSLSTLKSGTPATLVFHWRLREVRSGWRDEIVYEGVVRNRIYFDVLEEQYHLFNHQGRPLGACDALSGLTETLCQREAMELTRATDLSEESQYYVEMEVVLEILSDQEVRGFESWLRGDESTGPVSLGVELEEAEGLSNLALGVIKKIAGLGATTASSESPLFRKPPN